MINGEKHKTSRVSVGNLYDLNKDLVEKETKLLTQEELTAKKAMVLDFINKTQDRYYMLLCNERKDYTIFSLSYTDEVLPSPESATDILIDECLPNRGEIRSIELTKGQDAIEIWLVIDKKAYCYYFFEYDNAVIEC